MEAFVFVIAAAIIIGGALGVILQTNTVHCALSLIATLFGIAVLFLALDAHFLAAVQVIVYAGAIVVLFLFVIMLLGIDRADDLKIDTLAKVQRPVAAILGVAAFGLTITALFLAGGKRITGQRSAGAPLTGGEGNVRDLARALFSDYVFAFEVTSALLVIAVIGTVVLARRPPKPIEQEIEAERAATQAATALEALKADAAAESASASASADDPETAAR